MSTPRLECFATTTSSCAQPNQLIRDAFAGSWPRALRGGATRMIAFVALLCACGTPRAWADGPPAQARRPNIPAPVIRALRAYPFNQQNGTIEALDVLSANDGGRWNDTSTSALLVVVEVQGPPNQTYSDGSTPKYRVTFTASNLKTSETLISATNEVTSMSQTGVQHFPFLIPPKPCTSLKLKARVDGALANQSAVEGLAAFACGE